MATPTKTMPYPHEVRPCPVCGRSINTIHQTCPECRNRLDWMLGWPGATYSPAKALDAVKALYRQVSTQERTADHGNEFEAL